MKRIQKPLKEDKQLKGQELANYIKVKKKDFKNNGDALCVAAGYGKLNSDGTAKCDLPTFLKELSEAMEPMPNLKKNS